MKKLFVTLVVIWTLAGGGIYLAWWKVSRGLTPEEITMRSNQIANELRIPWTLKFDKVIPRLGADFRLVLEGIEATGAQGTVFKGKKAEVRLPWTLFLTHNPVRVNVTVSDVSVADWGVVAREVESWLDARRTDSSQEISLPRQLVDSSYNLRLHGVAGPYEGKPWRLDKLFLLNLGPKGPSAFEAVLPWEQAVGSARMAGETKILGEYRVSPTKIDLHYYLRNRLKLQKEGAQRTGEASIEGKGFYHPRLGFFSTLTAKDDWFALVGDIEWTNDHVQVNFPRFAVSHELLLDLLPYDGLRRGVGPYQGTGVAGELKWKRGKAASDFSFRLRGRDGLRTSVTGSEQKLSLEADWPQNGRTEVQIRAGETTLFGFKGGKPASLEWSPLLFASRVAPPSWLWPHSAVWDVAALLPWEELQLSSGDKVRQALKRDGAGIRVENLHPWEDDTRFSVLYLGTPPTAEEWVAEFESTPMEKVLELVPMESPAAAGYPFTGAIRKAAGGNVAFKLSWKGPPLALLSRSNCRLLIQDRPQLSDFLKEDYVHQAELLHRPPAFEVVKWVFRSPSTQWEVSGSWSNQPIRCTLKLKETPRGKKARTHEVVLN